MIRFVVLAVILVLSGSTLAECRDENCMTKETNFFTTGHTFYYNEVFNIGCLLYTSPSPRDATLSRMPSSA